MSSFQFDNTLIPAAHRPVEAALRPKWIALCRQIGVDVAQTETIYADLIRHYTGEMRFYHDLQHVADVLAAADELAVEIENDAAVRLAIWFHDVIYATNGQQDNERLSADYAVCEMSGAGASADLLATVHALILDTKHQAKPKTQDGCVIVDADLSTFAVSRERFNQHSADVRREFWHIEPDLYCNSRIALLDNMLNRDPLYYTKTMHDLYDANARANLKHAIEQLARGDLSFRS